MAGRKRKRSNSEANRSAENAPSSKAKAHEVNRVVVQQNRPSILDDVSESLSDTFEVDNLDSSSECASTDIQSDETSVVSGTCFSSTTLSDTSDSDSSSTYLSDSTTNSERKKHEFVNFILTRINLENAAPAMDSSSSQAIYQPNFQPIVMASLAEHDRHTCPDGNCARCLGAAYTGGATFPFQILEPPQDGFGAPNCNRRQNAPRSAKKMTVDQKIQASAMDSRTKELLLTSTSLCVKNPKWIEELLSIPFGVYSSVKTNKRYPHKPLEKLMDSMNAKVFGMVKVKEEILNFASQICSNPSSKPRVLGLCSRAGVGKCLAKGTRVWLACGSLIAVEDIQVGDELLGDDLKPRLVKELDSGINWMYRVNNSTGFQYQVTENHMITLKQFKEVHIELVQGEAVFYWLAGFQFYKARIEVKGLLAAHGVVIHDEPGIRRRALAYWRINIAKRRKPASDFKPRIIDIELSAYILLSKEFQELFTNHTLESVSKFNTPVVEVSAAKSIDFWFNLGHKYSQITDATDCHPNFLQLVQSLISQDMKCRYEFCLGFVFGAGLKKQEVSGIDGLCTKLKYPWIKPQGDPTTDCFRSVCLSVGMTCNINYQTRSVQIETNAPAIGSDSKPISVESIGQGEYFGFELSGNGRFLLEDLTVTHNTSIIQSLETGLDRSLQSINLNGMKDSSHLLGFDYTYSGAKHGAIIDAIIRAQIMNPILFFDELDKISDTAEGHEVVSVLMNLTDPISNQNFSDKYFHQVFFDLSRCIIIFAFNDETAIHPILKDRMHIIHIPVPSISEKVQIAQKFLLPQLCENIGLKQNLITFNDEVISFILRKYCSSEDGVRPLKRCLESIILRLNTMHMLAKSNVKLSYDLQSSLPIKLTEEHVSKLLLDMNDSAAGSHLSMYT